jgi:RNAse (barnase) inhibitor barstar
MTADDVKTRNSRQKQVYEIDGIEFSSLEGFCDEVSPKLIPDAVWGKNLDAFNDILRGGFGTPEGGFVLRWLNSNESREQLGFAETVRQLRRRLQCLPQFRSPQSHRATTASRIEIWEDSVRVAGRYHPHSLSRRSRARRWHRIRPLLSCAMADVNVRRSMRCVQNCSSYCSASEDGAKIAERKVWKLLKVLAGTTGLEPATSDVTGRRSNQLNYVPACASTCGSFRIARPLMPCDSH